MALWKCSFCGTTKESRCKPKKCPQCSSENTMMKQESEGSSEKACSSKKGSQKKKVKNSSS